MSWPEILEQGAVVLASMLAGLPAVQVVLKRAVRGAVRDELAPLTLRVVALEEFSRDLPVPSRPAAHV